MGFAFSSDTTGNDISFTDRHVGTFNRAKHTVMPVPDPNDAIGMVSFPKVMDDVFGEQWDSASGEPNDTDIRCKPSSTNDVESQDDCSSQGKGRHLETVT